MQQRLTIAVASGKGGTGKTTVAVNLYETIRQITEVPLALADCDVEEPNANIFLRKPLADKSRVNSLIPRINERKCNFCGKCADICAFNAIMFIKPLTHIEVMPDLCKSCGACSWVCPHSAIEEYEKELGQLFYWSSGREFVAEGRLKIGVPFAVPVIKEVKALVRSRQGVIILDAPPGTSCPVVETIHDTDFVLLVAEPTPFGLSDLKLMAETVKALNKPAGVVINRSMGENLELRNFLKKENLPVLLEIPYNRKLAEIYSKGNLITSRNYYYRKEFEKLFHRVVEVAGKELVI